MREIDLFAEMCEVEQRVLLSGQLPSVESYQRRRMGTSAVTVCLAMHEYVQFFGIAQGISGSLDHRYTLNMRLPQHVILNPKMQMLWDQTNIIIWV